MTDKNQIATASVQGTGPRNDKARDAAANTPILLFDIDGTLLTGCKAHGLALRQSIQSVYEVEPKTEGFRFGGKTDRHIIIEIATQSGVSKEHAAKFVEACITEMCSRFERLFAEEALVAFEGAKRTLVELERREARLALVTGNPKSIAFGKLKRVGLAEHFSTGGFGSDQHIQRSDLVELALRRLGTLPEISREHVFLIGDTSRDIEAAKIAGVRSVGVLTGQFRGESYEAEVLAAKPDYVVPSVGATAMLCEIFWSSLASS